MKNSWKIGECKNKLKLWLKSLLGIQSFQELMPHKYLKRLDYYIIAKFLGTYIFAIVLIISIAVVFDFNEKMDRRHLLYRQDGREFRNHCYVFNGHEF